MLCHILKEHNYVIKYVSNNIIIISVHRCARMCVHAVFICASTCKCVSIYGGQREPPWVLFFGNNSSRFCIFLDIIALWSGACQVGSLDWLVNTSYPPASTSPVLGV